jgi:ABC-2 type transporter
MTAVQSAPARPPAPQEEPTATEPARLPRSAIFADAVVIARRNLTRIARTPQLLVFATIQPVMFVLLFRYVFGGAIHVPGISYVDFLIPGVIVQTVVFGATSTAVGLSQDMSNGIIDRFRSLPMSRSAVLAGRTIADLVRNVFVVLLMIVVGMAVGFRFHNGFGPAGHARAGGRGPGHWWPVAGARPVAVRSGRGIGGEPVQREPLGVGEYGHAADRS